MEFHSAKGIKMTQRLFVSIPISKFLKEEFNRYRSLYPYPEIRWLPESNYHLTLSFYGETSQELIPSLIEGLWEVAKVSHPFNIEFSNVCFAPFDKPKRMVWAVFLYSADFEYLMQHVSKLCDQKTVSGTTKKTIPHVTIARFKKLKKMKGIHLEQPKLETKILEVRVMELQTSLLSPTGSQYTLLKTFHLGKKDQ